MSTEIVVVWLLLYALYLLVVIFLAVSYLRQYFFPQRKIVWPDIWFAPINLKTVVPAYMFYATLAEQNEMIWRDAPCQPINSESESETNNPILRRIASIIAMRY